eukprot:12772325-Alexandrium_andersonii.AAC.1
MDHVQGGWCECIPPKAPSANIIASMSELLVEMVKCGKNGVLPIKKLRTALQCEDAQRPCNLSPVSQEDWANATGTLLRLVLGKCRVLAGCQQRLDVALRQATLGKHCML